ncbi:ribosome maturation factor RimP [Deinococcus metalli]|uniref:Ribosome maturation factor RimP n=1 Tax=Deinococcus metalli TaxID=1141878 RepID=A0A7W8KEE2_9DEIO|nr:ribosome maturation factor RimP [Deinococcus metalli]MBB5375563.1 ribosome maturation factor RimP [Deinococcus metalli]GHF28339.1 ribosome maturation factor RimP [Deinococcus metalli]
MNNNPAKNTTTDNSRLQDIARTAVEPLGFEVLEVQQQIAGGERIVLVRIDRLDEQPVTMADLTAASRAADAEFDRLDPIPGEYRLEFESPGSKRPLTRARHFERMVGLKARVRADGHAFTAPIKGVQGEHVTFDVNGEDVTLDAGHIQANLAEFPDRHR